MKKLLFAALFVTAFYTIKTIAYSKTKADHSATCLEGFKNLDLTEQFTYQVKDQGSHGTCYAQAAVGLIEAAHFRESGERVAISAEYAITQVARVSAFQPADQDIPHTIRGKRKAFFEGGFLSPFLKNLQSVSTSTLSVLVEDDEDFREEIFPKVEEALTKAARGIEDKEALQIRISQILNQSSNRFLKSSKEFSLGERFWNYWDGNNYLRPISFEMNKSVVKSVAGFSKDLSETGYVLENPESKEAIQHYQKLSPDNSLSVDDWKSVVQSHCAQSSRFIVQEIVRYLCRGIPVAVGLRIGGLNFGPPEALRNTAFWFKSESGNHGMVVVGLRRFGGKGYLVLRNSNGRGNAYAFLPLNEGCRLMDAVVLLSPQDL
jgi:hypothetical protein